MQKVYVPSRWGDVQLERDGEQCKLVFTDLTPYEEKGVEKFLKAYGISFSSNSRALGPKEASIAIFDSLEKAHKKFLKAFKPGRQIINAIKLKDGKIEIVGDFVGKDGVGISVERPHRGCPPPITEEKEIRAQAVLREFLSPQQWSDFEKHLAFLSRGNHSGRRYLITSRWSPLCETRGLVYCLDTRRHICANQMRLPPAEEMLAFKICIECDEAGFIGN